MDWWATVQGVARVGHNLATKPQGKFIFFNKRNLHLHRPLNKEEKMIKAHEIYQWRMHFNLSINLGQVYQLRFFHTSSTLFFLPLASDGIILSHPGVTHFPLVLYMLVSLFVSLLLVCVAMGSPVENLERWRENYFSLLPHSSPSDSSNANLVYLSYQIIHTKTHSRFY